MWLGDPKYVPRQCPHPHGEMQLALTSQADSPRVTVGLAQASIKLMPLPGVLVLMRSHVVLQE